MDMLNLVKCLILVLLEDAMWMNQACLAIVVGASDRVIFLTVFKAVRLPAVTGMGRSKGGRASAYLLTPPHLLLGRPLM